MIKSFVCEDTKNLYEKGKSRKFSSFLRVAGRKLAMLDAAMDIDDLRKPPANHLEALQGDRAGQYSIRINDQFRLCFEWKDGHAYRVEIVDYH